MSNALFGRLRSDILCEQQEEQVLRSKQARLQALQAQLDQAALVVTDCERRLAAKSKQRLSRQEEVQAAVANSTLTTSCLSHHLQIYCLQLAGAAERYKMVMTNREWNRVVNEGYQQRSFRGLNGMHVMAPQRNLISSCCRFAAVRRD